MLRPWFWPIAGGLLAAIYIALSLHRYPHKIKDFDQHWVAARALVHGQNPYDLIGPGKALPFTWPYFYPITTAVACLPFTAVSLTTARLLFVGISVALLVWTTQRGGWRMLVPLLMSCPFQNSLWNVQWSMLLTAAMARPDVLSGLAGVKPPLCPAAVGACTTRRQVIVAVCATLLLVAGAFWFRPRWIPEWAATLRSANHFLPPVARPGGPLLLLALLRWRDPRARILLGLSLMPQTPMWYEALPLCLIPRSFKERTILAIAGNLAFLAMAFYPRSWTFNQGVFAIGVLMQVTQYLPCLLLLFLPPPPAELPWKSPPM